MPLKENNSFRMQEKEMAMIIIVTVLVMRRIDTLQNNKVVRNQVGNNILHEKKPLKSPELLCTLESSAAWHSEPAAPARSRVNKP